MDNSSGGGTPAPPPSSASGATPDVHSEAPAEPPSAPVESTEEPQFTVPVPTYSPPTQALPLTAAPPPVPAPWTAASVYPPPTGAPLGQAATPYAAYSLARQAPSDADSLRNLGLVLLGVVIGFWLFVLIRITAYVVEVGATDRILIETIDAVSGETVTAALVSILAVASITASRISDKRRPGGPLLWSTAALAVITITTAVWRLV